MKIPSKGRIGTLAAAAGAVTAILTLGLASPASASSVPAFELRVCSSNSFKTNAYWPGGYLGVEPGQCRSHYWQEWGPNPSLVLHVDTWVSDGKYIAGVDVDIANGAGVHSGGSKSSPYLWTF